MAPTSALLPPVKVEALSTSTSTPPPSESSLTKHEQANMPAVENFPPLPPHIVDSIGGLRSLSTALSVFLSRYDELHDHLDFIRTSIDSKLPKHLLTNPNPNQSTLIPLPETSSATTKTLTSPVAVVSEQNPNGIATDCKQSHGILRKPEETNASKKPEETGVLKKPEEIDVSKKPEETDVLKKSEETDDSKKHSGSELESLCETMSGRGIKAYIAMRINDMNRLREEVPKALKLAKDPAKLVLEGIGRFFLQGSRAYFKGSQEILRRQAAIVFLECFLMISSDVEIAKEEEEYAAKAAFDWRKRIIHEGGLARAEEPDARGLLLLISGFGIPNGLFKNEDIRDLIKASNVKEISTALRRSIILIPKIPEIIDWMVKNNLEIEAVDIAYTFGLEDKCPPRTILTTFLRNKIKDKQHGSSAQAKEAIKKQLADLKSITKCLKTHKVDPSKVLPDFNINEIMSRLEKESKELDLKAADERATQKRKAKEAESSRKLKQQEPKRTRVSVHNNVPEEQKAVDHGYGKSSYEGLTQTSSYFDGRLPSDYISAYSTSLLRGSENMTSSVAVGSGGGSGMLTGSYGAGVYAATVAADQMVNKNNGQPYDWHDDTALVEKYLGQNYSRQIQAYNSQPSPTPGLIGLYSRPSGSSLATFAGRPDPASSVGVSSRGGGPASDLYSFADSIVESESYPTSGGPHASGSGTMRSSYLY